MAFYTIQVKDICQMYANSTGLTSSSPLTIIQAALPFIFDFDYPIFDVSYRNILETKIIRHFYTREIGAETIALWKFWLENKLNEIMPYYNQLYKSTTFDFNPLYDVDYTVSSSNVKNENADATKSSTNSGTDVTRNSGNNTNTRAVRDTGTKHVSTVDRTNDESKIIQTVTGDTNTDTTNNLSNNSTSWEYQNNTPQGDITGISELSYLSYAQKNTNLDTNSGTVNVTETNNSSSNGTNSSNAESIGANDTDYETHKVDTLTENKNTSVSVSSSLSSNENAKNKISSTDEYVEKVVGKRNSTSYSSLIKEYRDSLINIDMLIISDLNDLFMLIWG